MDSVVTAALNASKATNGDNERMDINFNGISSSKFTDEYKAVVFKATTAAKVK